MQSQRSTPTSTSSISGHKFAVYTIVKNAESYIYNWVESAQGADYLILGDTGSTDRTVAVARKLGATVYKIKPDTPFHFANARNAILAKVPSDAVCISLDADETLGPNWRVALEQEWSNTLMTVNYSNGLHTSKIARIHPRNAVWKDRIHEYLYVDSALLPSSVTILHEQDMNRDRSWYIDLLESQIAANESMPRSLAMLGKEHMVRGNTKKAVECLEKYLTIDTDYMQERANVCNLLYYLTKRIEWLYQSIFYCPPQREAYQRLAAYMAHNGDWIGAYHYATMSLAYPPLEVFTEYLLTEESIVAILAEAAFQTGRRTEAVEKGEYLADKYPNGGHSQNLTDRYYT
jgi:glycosyltransferase involved in cell wall biosynthesis